jgi:hypothetical protein
MTVPNVEQPDCTCEHALSCNHGCHGRHCDPTEHVCSLEFLPDDGGLTPWGCAECTPGGLLPHLDGCPVAAAVPVAAGAAAGSGARAAPIALA